MKELICEMCNGNNLLKQDDVFICQDCKTKYTIEEAKKMMSEDALAINKSTVAHSTRFENLYKIARRAREAGNSEQALKNYEHLEMEDPDNWESVFFVAYYSAVNTLKNDKEGDSVQVTGNSVILGNNWRSGIEPAIYTITNCLDSVFSLIESIKDYDQQKLALETVDEYVGFISENLSEIIKIENHRMSQEINDWSNQVEGGFMKSMKMSAKRGEKKAQYDIDVSNMLNLVKEKKEYIEEVVGVRRFDEYWNAHQSEKEDLETEKESLLEEISAINNEVSETPQKTEGYSTMLELQKKSELLATEKKALGLFKLKEKKAIQEQINLLHNQITPLQARIDSAVDMVKQRIIPLQNRIDEIDNELTMPR